MKNEYDYIDSMTVDIMNWFEENEDANDKTYQEVYDLLWVEDSVTGNASGSYTFSTAKAEEYVKDNFDLLVEACDDFGIDNQTLGEKIRWSEWEYLDVTIRCYLLGQCLAKVMDFKEVKYV